MPQLTLVCLRRQTFATSFLVTLLIALGANAHAFGQKPKDDPERARAFKLFNESKFTEAVPLLEKLAKAYPDDPAVFEKYGVALYVATKSVNDPQTRKLMIARAKEALLRSQQLGNDSYVLKTALEGVALGDIELIYSQNKEANALMHEGVRAYVQGDRDKAGAAYERAFALDPQLYQAPLSAGDVYFNMKEWDKAGEWFARAIAVNPDRETAYRYWGDALMMGHNKREESRQKFVDAIVAEPYNRRAWIGLTQWSHNYAVPLGHPRIEPPASVSPLKDNKMTITIDESVGDKADGSGAWIVYGMSRAVWSTEKFAREFPSEKNYRHSLREEAGALRSVAELVKQQLKDGKIKQLDPMIEQLVNLYDEGLIEAYVLFARVDEGIAEDYVAYRKTNRDKLRRYLLEYVSAGD